LNVATDTLTDFLSKIAAEVCNKTEEQVFTQLQKIFCKDCVFPMAENESGAFPAETRVMLIGGSDNPFPLSIRAMGGSDDPFPLGQPIFAILVCSNPNQNRNNNIGDCAKLILESTKSLNDHNIPCAAAVLGFDSGNA
jgi:hypothetical protein